MTTIFISDFIIGGMASVGATVFTNPLEVILFFFVSAYLTNRN